MIYTLDMEEKIIENLGIYELRTLARKVGVQSPTTKKRAELIHLIRESMKNPIITDDKLVKKGRPPKNMSSTDEFFQQIMENNSINNDIIFRSNDDETLQEFMAEGVIQFHNNYFIYNQDKIKTFENVYLTEKFVQENNLKIGDYVEVVALGNKDDRYGQAKKLISKNYGLKDRNLNIANVDISVNKQIYNELYQGDRVIFKESSDLKKVFSKHIEDLKEIEKNYKVVLIANNLSPEEYIILNQNDYIKFLTSYEDDIDKQKNNVEIAIEHIKRLLSIGENVFVLGFNFDDLLQNINLLYSKKVFPLTLETIELAKRLLSLGRNIEGDASVTLCFSYENKTQDYMSIFDRILTNKF